MRSIYHVYPILTYGYSHLRSKLISVLLRIFLSVRVFFFFLATGLVLGSSYMLNKYKSTFTTFLQGICLDSIIDSQINTGFFSLFASASLHSCRLWCHLGGAFVSLPLYVLNRRPQPAANCRIKVCGFLFCVLVG